MSRHLFQEAAVEHAWERPVAAEVFTRARLALQKERWQEAERLARALLDAEAVESTEAGPGDEKPTVRDAARLLADALYMMDRYEECLDFCDRAVERGILPPDDSFVRLLQGWIMSRRQQIRPAYELAGRRLNRPAADLTPSLRAGFLHIRGLCAMELGHPRQARQCLHEAVALARAAGDEMLQAEVLNALGMIEKMVYRVSVGAERIEEALRLSRRLGEQARRAQCLLNLAVARTKSGRPQVALTMLDEAREIHLVHGKAGRRLNLALARAKALLELDRSREAKEETEPVLTEARRLRNHRIESLALEVLGDCALAGGRVRKARRYFEQGLRVAGHAAAGADLAAGLHRRRGQAILAEDDPTGAVTELRRAVKSAAATAERFEEGIAQRFLAAAYRQLGRFGRAYVAGRRAVAILRDMGAELELARALLETARVQFAWWRTREGARGGSLLGMCETVAAGAVAEAPELPDCSGADCLRGHLEAAWSYVVEAWHAFNGLDREDGRRACAELMDRLRADAEPPWREKGLVRVLGGGKEKGGARAATSGEFVARAPVMRRLLESIQMAADSSDPVLVSGETGSGKELVSRLVHLRSGRADGPWVAVNCAAVPESLFEREFFGHTRGAFSGADGGRPGLCEKADGGTLLLDEIGEMPLPVQAKLLRLLQEGTYRRLGDPTERRVDLRVVAATNADLARQIAEGRFRKDLFYRLRILELWLPPLRERGEDIDSLVDLFVRQAVETGATPADLFDEEVREALRRYPWPGNVRELEGMTRRLAVMAQHAGRATARMLPPEMARWVGRPAGGSVASPATGTGRDLSLAAHLERAERERIVQALTTAGGNRTEAARLLEISRNTLYKKMERLGIRIPA